MVEHRSVSQLKLYERCPMAYYLSRVEKVWQRPAAWLGQGSAVHEAAEAYERSGRTMTLEAMQDVFRDSYATHINEACEITPNFEYWFKSGPYGGELDVARRYQIGLEQCEKYMRWYENHPQEVIWITDDGTPAIELGFDIDLDGVLVRGFIDAVIETPCPVNGNPEITVRDNKTGNHPGDDFQLGVYGVAISKEYGIDPVMFGDYFMCKTGKPTYPFKISEWTEELVTRKFHELEDNIQAGRFDPTPSPDVCRFCDVSSSCEYAV
jgi:putative RecB family exonuclease